jgi:diketogulonate reductase-like aldo/keto reductase
MTTNTITLNNGVTMPAIGLGVFQTPPEETHTAVETALAAGYRHIDTAAAYFNEKEVGKGLANSDVDRSKVFVETKIWITDYGYDETLHAFDKSAGKLGIDQIDLLILHNPMPTIFNKTLGSYRALEKLLADGKVRAIGVSNFSVEQLTSLLDVVDVVPAVNQIQLHPYFQQRDVQAFDTEHSILTQAWSPIGGITFYGENGEQRSTLDDETIGGIAAMHSKSPAQVMLRWHLQQGRSAIPKSTNPQRIAQNLDICDFELSADQLQAHRLPRRQQPQPHLHRRDAPLVRRRHPRGINRFPLSAHRHVGARAPRQMRTLRVRGSEPPMPDHGTSRS